MKLALDVWYALWEGGGNESDPGLRTAEKDGYHRWAEDYRAGIGDERAHRDSAVADEAAGRGGVPPSADNDVVAVFVKTEGRGGGNEAWLR